MDILLTTECAYVRFEVADLNGKALGKTIPWRHRHKPVSLYAGSMAMGADCRVLTFPREVAQCGLGNAKLLPDWRTLKVLPWATLKQGCVARVICELHQSVATVGTVIILS